MYRKGILTALVLTLVWGAGIVGVSGLQHGTALVGAIGGRLPPCSAPTLKIQGGRQGEAGGAHGDILFMNTGSTPCVLHSIPTDIALLRADGSVLPVRLKKNSAKIAVQAVVLDPHSANAADLGVYWGNWCGAKPGALRVRVTLANGGGMVTGGFDGPPDYNLVPPCLAAGQPSTLWVDQGLAPSPPPAGG